MGAHSDIVGLLTPSEVVVRRWEFITYSADGASDQSSVRNCQVTSVSAATCGPHTRGNLALKMATRAESRLEE